MSSDNKQVRVRFVTEYDDYRIVDSPFAVPDKLGRKGLTDVVNHLLESTSDVPQAFDFSINDVLLRVPLRKFIERERLSVEKTITIVYFPLTSWNEEDDEVGRAETPSWVGSLATASNTVCGACVIAGCYDGSVKVFDSSSPPSSPSSLILEMGSLQAHDEPVRAVVAWNSDIVPGTSCFATASKDQSVKIWSMVCNTGNSSNDMGSGRKQKNSKAKSKIACTFRHHATLTGHMNSVESMALLRTAHSISNSSGNRNSTGDGDQLLVSGDWNGNVFLWKDMNTVLQSADDNNSASASTSTSTSSSSQAINKKRRTSRLEAGAGNADSSGAYQPVVASMKPLHVLKAHNQSVSGIGTWGGSINSIQANTMDASSLPLMVNRMVTCSWDHSLKVWDLERRDCIHTSVCGKVFTSLDCAPGAASAEVLSSHPDGKVRLWDLRSASSSSSSSSSSSTGSSSATAACTFGSQQQQQWVSQVKWMPPGSNFTGSGGPSVSSSCWVFAATDYAGVVTLWDKRCPLVPLGHTERHSGKALCLHWQHDGNNEAGSNGDDSMGNASGGILTKYLFTGGSDCFVHRVGVNTPHSTTTTASTMTSSSYMNE